MQHSLLYLVKIVYTDHMKINALTVDEWKTKLGVGSRYAVAKHLGIRESTAKHCADLGTRLSVHDGKTYLIREAKQI